MFEFLREYQVNIMLALSSICAIIAVFTMISKIMTTRRKVILLAVEICAAVWLEADRIAYLDRGISGVSAYWSVRISNFLVFLMTVTVLTLINLYLADVLKDECSLEKTPLAIMIGNIMGAAAIFLVVISPFTGLYYTIDENNLYHRSPYYFVSFIFPYMILLIQLGVLIYYRKLLSGKIALSIFLFVAGSLTASMIQYFAYGVSLVDMVAVAMVIVLYIFALIDMNERVERATRIEMESLRGEHENMRRLFEQTATALATAIDAKDTFAQGHSVRVAEYAKEIARLSGLDEKKCDEVYYAGLLHDVGKIGIADSIIQKDVNLTPEEYDMVKTHTNLGGEILANINGFPFLSIGAKYHHERYDGKGYPEGLTGENIPEIARIVAVADSYDSMTSRRSYREPMPQSTVREEIVKGSGTQHDPRFSEIMVNMIDHDTEYMMREKDIVRSATEGDDLTVIKEMRFGEYKSNVSEGIQITDRITTISFDSQSEIGFDEKISIPAIILFDAHDGCVHKDDAGIRLLHYLEYGEIWMDGNIIDTAARDMRKSVTPLEDTDAPAKGVTHYEIEAVRHRDHVRIKIKNHRQLVDVTAALLDSIRFCYIALSGEHCHIMNISVRQSEEAVDENYITRIAEETSFINKLEADIPNVQVEGYRSAYTQAVPVVDGMRLRFRTMSLPTANLIWHCAYMLLFSSDDAIPLGKNYLELGCIRLDGENATNNDLADNQVEVHKDEDFTGWDGWKKDNKKGFECEVTVKRRKNRIIMETRNAGISVKSITGTSAATGEIYMALTGDQCALTDIRVM